MISCLVNSPCSQVLETGGFDNQIQFGKFGSTSGLTGLETPASVVTLMSGGETETNPSPAFSWQPQDKLQAFSDNFQTTQQVSLALVGLVYRILLLRLF